MKIKVEFFHGTCRNVQEILATRIIKHGCFSMDRKRAERYATEKGIVFSCHLYITLNEWVGIKLEPIFNGIFGDTFIGEWWRLHGVYSDQEFMCFGKYNVAVDKVYFPRKEKVWQLKPRLALS